MNILMEHWLSLGVGTCLLAMILYGHYRGFLRMAVSMLALVVSIIAVPVIMPHVTELLNKNTIVHQAVGKGLLDMAGAEAAKDLFPEIEQDGTDGFLPSPSQQRELIEKLKLPEQMRDSLLEHNNTEIYHLLGVDAFLDYLGSYLARMVINLLGSVILFLAIFIGIRLLIRWMDLIARLPILHGINQIAGAVLGGAQGLLIIWFLGLLVRVFSSAQWAQAALAQIQGSLWLRFLYEQNPINRLFVGILNSLAV